MSNHTSSHAAENSPSMTARGSNMITVTTQYVNTTNIRIETSRRLLNHESHSIYEKYKTQRNERSIDSQATSRLNLSNEHETLLLPARDMSNVGIKCFFHVIFFSLFLSFRKLKKLI